MGYEIDFLPVGEGEQSGDAIVLRFGDLYGERSQQTVIVVDGGFKESGEELVKHVKKYYGTSRVDLVVSTHPDADHAGGLEVVLEELEVGRLWMHQPWNHTDDIARMFKDGRVTDDSVRKALRRSLDTARGLERLAEKKGIPLAEPFAGLTDDAGCLRVLGPTEDFYESLLPDFRGTPEPKEGVGVIKKVAAEVREIICKIAERWDFETLDDEGETSAENNSSTVLLLTVDGRTSLLTGDAGIPALINVADLLEAEASRISTLKFIQVPHHGSQRNVGPSVLDRLVGPKQSEDKKIMTSFVSASKGGAPKHPSKKVTNAFRRRGAPVCTSPRETMRHSENAPDREGWKTLTPLPFYNEVED
jgi:beta-lactamase superfamily II metal-dependent hydrolase